MKDIGFEKYILNKYLIEIYKDNLITIYPKNYDGSPNLDTGFRLESNNTIPEWKLYEIQRDKAFFIALFKREEIGLLSIFLRVKRSFDIEELDIDQQTKNSLKKINHPVQGIAILEQQLSEGLFSYDVEVRGAINIFKENTTYTVCYISHYGKNIEISKNRPLNSAFSLTYNYCKILEYFLCLIEDWKEKLSITVIEEEELKRVFLEK